MKKEDFIQKLRKKVSSLPSDTQSENLDWNIKGFVDIKKDIYSLSPDTKLISKVLELYLYPQLWSFALEHNLKVILAKEQNYYPDLTFIDDEQNLYAVDVKSSYRKSSKSIKGMTLGAFTGYFRHRESDKNVTFPYSQYSAHIILGIIYSLAPEIKDNCKIFKLDDINQIASVIRDLAFFVQEKWRIATDKPGSGNTCNIGSTGDIGNLVNGNGPFSELGEKIFDDYWTNYLTKEMARRAELTRPYYTSLKEYKDLRGL